MYLLSFYLVNELGIKGVDTNSTRILSRDFVPILGRFCKRMLHEPSSMSLAW